MAQTINDFIHPVWKWNGHRLKKHFSTKDIDEIEKMREALRKDMEDCGCNPQDFGPRHSRSYIYQGTAYTSQCESYGRWYNPDTGRMEGSRHCTCGTCFD